jgi:hypothetical protein
MNVTWSGKDPRHGSDARANPWKCASRRLVAKAVVCLHLSESPEAMSRRS